jgi:hypothetical protein
VLQFIDILESVSRLGRKGESVTGIHDQILFIFDEDSQPACHYEHEFHLYGKEVHLISSAPTRFNVTENRLHPSLTARSKEVLHHPFSAKADPGVLP